MMVTIAIDPDPGNKNHSSLSKELYLIIAFSNMHLLSILGIVTVCSVAIFLVIWFLMNTLYSKTLGKWSFVDRFIEKTRGKGESPIIKRYGLIGLALLMAIPIPTIGVYGGTLLSWLMGMKLRSSLVAVVSGDTVSNTIVLFTAFGITKAVGLFG